MKFLMIERLCDDLLSVGQGLNLSCRVQPHIEIPELW
jgi:hypothetical protein